MMRKGLICAMVLALAGCAADGSFDDPRYRADGEDGYGQYLAAREAALRGQAAAPRAIPRSTPFEAPTPDEIAGPTALEIARRELGGGQPRATTVAQPTGQGGYIDPVTGALVVARPGAVVTVPAGATVATLPADPPARVTTSADSPAQTLIRYALTQTHAPGTAAFNRSGGSEAHARATCRSYANAASAQLAFIASGGPQADPLGLDPDGDGFVCGWNPAPYRVNAGL
ncbi:MAG: hypothetical protein Q4G36_04850 [Paracoccus sp. (in: a-proteobacteria)]|nr:hypothetical protein [Paracoccus sp. (in: a-proteobacteria)]